MARRKNADKPVESSGDDYRAVKRATLTREVEVKQAELADLEVRLARYADEG